jgi:hypothetical protein
MTAIKEEITDQKNDGRSKYKIMWILKEGNISYEDREKNMNIGTGFLSDWQNANAMTSPTFIKMIYATYGIQHPEKIWSEVSYANADAYEAIKQIAYININKYPARAFSDYAVFKQAYARNKETLLKQIEDCNPNIIIFGGTWSFFEIDVLKSIGWDVSLSTKRYVDEENIGNTTTFYVFSTDKICINAPHPSSAGITDKKYWLEIKSAVKNWEDETSKIKNYFG